MVGSWSQNIDMPEKPSNVASDGLLCRYGIIISFTYKVASRVKSDGLKAIVVHSVVLWRNSKGWTCGAGAVWWAGSLGLWID